MKPIRLLSGFLTVGVWTLLSRVLGFARDIFIAARLGDGPVAEAFVVAFSLPNMFRRFFAEGAFNMAFVPMFSKRVEKGEDAAGFAQEAFAALGTLLIGFTLIAQAAMPWLVLAMASGFVGDERFDLATDYGRIAFPYILFISLAALLSGVLNATGRFAAAAAAPVLLNIILVSAMAMSIPMGWDFGRTLAWAVPVAGVAQFALVWMAARKAGFTLRPAWPRFSPDIRRLAKIAAPAVLAGGVVQINLIVGRQVASQFEGAIQYLNLSDRLYQLPLGVVAIAIGVVLLPELSRRLAADDTEAGQSAFNRAAEFSLLLTLPASVALIVVPEPLVTVLYMRGAFDYEAAQATALVTAIYGAGLPAFVLQKVLQPVFYARHDTRSPFRFALVAMLVNVVVAVGLAPVIGFSAAAVGTTLAGWVMLWLLWRGSRSVGPAAEVDDRLRHRVLRIVAASLTMGAVLWLVDYALGHSLLTRIWRYPSFIILIGSGVVSYAIAAQLFGAASLGEVRGMMRRSKKAA